MGEGANQPEIKTLAEAVTLFNQKVEPILSGQKTMAETTQELKNNIDSLQDQLDKLEVKGKRRGPTTEPDGSWFDTPQGKAVDAYMRLGEKGMVLQKPELVPELKAQLVNDGTQGGFLTPPEWERDIIKDIVEVSPVRQLANVGTMSTATMMVPKRTTTPIAFWVAEADPDGPTETNSQWTLQEIKAHTLAAIIDISREALEDPGYDLAAEVISDATEQFEAGEARSFLFGAGPLAGNSPNQPQGFIPALVAGGRITQTGDSTKLTGPGLVRAFYAPKGRYSSSGVWLMNRQTIRETRLLVDLEGRPIWNANLGGLIQGSLPTIMDRPYYEAPDMAMPNDAGAYTTGDVAAFFGDLKRLYRIRDRRGLVVVRDDTTLLRRNMVRFFLYKRVAGAPVQLEAGQLLRVGT